jgi:hypothetical protein
VKAKKPIRIAFALFVAISVFSGCEVREEAEFDEEDPLTPIYGGRDRPMDPHPPPPRGPAGAEPQWRFAHVEEALRDSLERLGVDPEEAAVEADRLTRWILAKFREEDEIREMAQQAFEEQEISPERAAPEAEQVAQQIHAAIWAPIREAEEGQQRQ